MEALRTRREDDPLHPGAPRGGGGLHGLRATPSTPGKLGVCLATSGPGGLHLLNGLYDAKLDRAARARDHRAPLPRPDRYARPAGRGSRPRLRGRQRLHDAASWARRTWRTSPHLACRTALAYRGVAHINFPVDLQEQQGRRALAPQRPGPHLDVLARRARLPDQADLARAAEILNAGKKIAILAGQGALGAHRRAGAAGRAPGGADRQAAARQGGGARRQPVHDGRRSGSSAPGPRRTRWRSATRCCWSGTSFPYIEFYPKPGQARGSPDRRRSRRASACAIRSRSASSATAGGPCRRCCRSCAGRTTAVPDQGAGGHARVAAAHGGAGARGRDAPMKPQVVALGARQAPLLDRDRVLRLGHHRDLVRTAHPGPARADALAVRAPSPRWPTACPTPSRPRSPTRTGSASAFVGDGGFSMLMAEFATAVKYELPIKIVVVKNDTLGQIKWEQMVFLGNPEYGCDLQPIDFVAFARACGGAGFRIEDPAECGAVLDQALGTPGPVLVEAVVDPFEPPMPPKVTVKQAAKFARVARPRRTEPRAHRPDRAGGQGAGADLERKGRHETASSITAAWSPVRPGRRGASFPTASPSAPSWRAPLRWPS